MREPTTQDERVALAEHEGYEAGIEEQATQAARALCRALVAVADPIWRWGDGCGGYVLHMLWEEAEQLGQHVGLSEEFRPTPRVEAIAKRDGWRCHYCWAALGLGDPEIVQRPHVEHVIPKAQGGHSRLSNLVLSCPRCNMTKGARTPSEWLGKPCCASHPA